MSLVNFLLPGGLTLGVGHLPNEAVSLKAVSASIGLTRATQWMQMLFYRRENRELGIGMINRTIANKSTETLLSLYKTIVRPLVECGILRQYMATFIKRDN